jgi:hypothetical protein
LKKTVVGLSLVLLLAFGAHAGLATPQPDASIIEDIVHFRKQTWTYQTLMGVQRTPVAEARLSKHSTGYKLWVRSLWRTRLVRTKNRFDAGPPHKSAWLCIHRYEASWRDSGAPYYGGLQMDYSFMRTYGARLLQKKGTAEHWTPAEQMWVAERAYRSGRGFNPWPSTARMCGVL